MTSARWIITVTVLLAGAAWTPIRAAGGPAAQGPDPQVRAHVDAFARALASLDAEAFEAMARDHFTPDLLARRTPESRKELVQRLKADFGTITVGKVVATPDGTVVLEITGSTDLAGRVELTLEPVAPFRIAKMGLTAEAGGSAQAPRPAPTPAPISPAMPPAQMTAALDGYLRPMAAVDQFAGVVLVARNGVPVYERAFGLADREKRTPIAAATRFNLGSINKIFTKTAIGQLIAAGRLSLTDTVGALLPDYPNPKARAATVDQLLNHRGGIADFFSPEFDRAPKTRFRSNTDYYHFVAPLPLTFDPGTKTAYCNGCYVVLGAIIERISGVRYEDYIEAHVFRPAGMNGAAFLQADRFPADVAIGYTTEGAGAAGARRSNEAFHGMSGSAAGGAYATAADLLAFDNALRERRLLDAKMTAWVLGGEEATTGRARGGIGVAGGAPGCNAALDSDGEWTVAVVGNLDPPNAERVAAALRQALMR
jgi:CubicO group peptidase (beta-lactamase class C family)